jgi:hypothetical protein
MLGSPSMQSTDTNDDTPIRARMNDDKPDRSCLLLLAISAIFRFVVIAVPLAKFFGTDGMTLTLIGVIALLASAAFCDMDRRLLLADNRARALRAAVQHGLPMRDGGPLGRLKQGLHQRTTLLTRFILSLAVMSLASVLFELVLFQPDIARELERRFAEVNRPLFQATTERIESEIAQARNTLTQLIARGDELAAKAQSTKGRPIDTREIDQNIASTRARLAVEQQYLVDSNNEERRQEAIMIGEETGQCSGGSDLPCTGKKGKDVAYQAASARMQLAKEIADGASANIKSLTDTLSRLDDQRATRIAEAQSAAEAAVILIQQDISKNSDLQDMRRQAITRGQDKLLHVPELAAGQPGFVDKGSGLLAQVTALEAVVWSSQAGLLFWGLMTVACSAIELAPLISMGTSNLTIAAVREAVAFETGTQWLVADAIRSGDPNGEMAALERELELLDLMNRVETKRRESEILNDLKFGTRRDVGQSIDETEESMQ